MHSQASELGGKIRSRLVAGLERHVPKLTAELERHVPALRRRLSPPDHPRDASEDESQLLEAEGADDAPQPADELLVLHGRLLHARHLMAMDSCGTSDPYVKFKLGSKTVYKSTVSHKTLNPVWNETFQVTVKKQFKILNLKVYDYDWGLNDDFLGQARVDLSALPLDEEKVLTLSLSGRTEATATHRTSDGRVTLAPFGGTSQASSLGTVTVALRLVSLTEQEIEQIAEYSRSEDEGKQRTQPWSHVVHVVLVKGKDLASMDVDLTSDPYVKFRLGKEKYKTKTVAHSLNPYWDEECRFHLYKDGPQRLELEVFDRDLRTSDDFMGKASLDLSSLQTERTHRVWLELERGAGSVLLLVTVSGTTHVETASDLLCHQNDPPHTTAQKGQLSWWRTLERLTPLGHLSVKVLRARGLAAADLNGRSDPFCVLQLVNQRRQTQTVYKTLTPYWNKVFEFDVTDMHAVLEVAVYDQDKDHSVDFLGKLDIPLLQIQSGKRRWYQLKDEKLHHRAGGKNPQILLEMDIIFNTARAAIRTFTPREPKYAQPPVRFKMATFVRILNRLNALSVRALELNAFLRSVFSWESAPKTMAVWIGFLCFTSCFQLYMVPSFLLMTFIGRWMMRLVPFAGAEDDDDGYNAEDKQDDDDEDSSSSDESLELDLRYWRYLPDEKKTLKEKVLSVQEVTALVQTSAGSLASLTERIVNTADFAVPFVSWLAVLVLVAATVLCYHIPSRYLVMLAGSYMFIKGLIWPGSVSTNELLNFLARVPDNEQLRQRQELDPARTTASSRRRRQRARYKRRHPLVLPHV